MSAPPDPDPHPTSTAPAGPASPASPSRPAIDLGPHLEAIAFAPGRFAAVIQRTLAGAHAAQRLRESSTASFVLELAGDGGATACRGWRYHANNDGPRVHTEDRFEEQRGYRGRHALRDGLVEVTLAADDTVCAPRTASDAPLARATQLTLRCVLAAPKGHPRLAAPVLLCRWIDVATDEARAHLAPGLGVDDWMVLGTGNGLRVKVTGQPPGSRTGAPTEVEVTVAAAPLAADSWREPF